MPKASNVVQLGAFHRRKQGIVDCQGEIPDIISTSDLVVTMNAFIQADDAVNEITKISGPVESVRWLQEKIRRIQEALRK